MFSLNFIKRLKAVISMLFSKICLTEATRAESWSMSASWLRNVILQFSTPAKTMMPLTPLLPTGRTKGKDHGLR